MSAALAASQSTFALPDGGDADLGPGRHRIDTQLVDIRAAFFGGGESRFHVLPAGAQIGQAHDGFTGRDIAHFELFLEQDGQFGGVYFLRADRGLHGHSPVFTAVNLDDIQRR